MRNFFLAVFILISISTTFINAAKPPRRPIEDEALVASGQMDWKEWWRVRRLKWYNDLPPEQLKRMGDMRNDLIYSLPNREDVLSVFKKAKQFGVDSLSSSEMSTYKNFNKLWYADRSDRPDFLGFTRWFDELPEIYRDQYKRIKSDAYILQSRYDPKRIEYKKDYDKKYRQRPDVKEKNRVNSRLSVNRDTNIRAVDRYRASEKGQAATLRAQIRAFVDKHLPSELHGPAEEMIFESQAVGELKNTLEGLKSLTDITRRGPRLKL